jgi:hypothetical protein
LNVLSTFLTGQVSTDDGRKIAANFAGGTLTTGEDVCLPRGPVTAKFVLGGSGNPAEIPASVSGKIAQALLKYWIEHAHLLRNDTALECPIDIRHSRRDLMAHENGDLSDRSSRDAQSALESAARQLRASPTPARPSAARGREILRRRQERDLLAWASEQGRLIQPDTYLSIVVRGGQEHRVWLDESRQRYLKTTFPGKFGFTVITNPAQVPDLADGTPSEYLERLLLQNSLFGDLIELEGIAQELGQTVILTSQPHITGMDVSQEDIQNFMARQWFKPLNGLQIGRPGALAFYRDLDEVAAFVQGAAAEHHGLHGSIGGRVPRRSQAGDRIQGRDALGPLAAFYPVATPLVWLPALELAVSVDV